MSPRSGASTALFKHANENKFDTATVNSYSQGDDLRSSQGHGPLSPKRSPTCLSLSVSGLSPRPKRARTADVRDVAPPSVVKEHDRDEPVRALWAVAFPSLPDLPLAVSAAVSTASLADSLPASLTPSSSCSHTPSSPSRPTPIGGAEAAASPSYGWFVFTDADGGDGGGAPTRGRPAAATGTFLPGAPGLPSRILEVDAAAPGAGHQQGQGLAEEDLSAAGKTFLPVATPALPGAPLAFERTSDQELAEQQALAADTVDDVLGDLF